jgi:hypothetical protein
MMLTIASLIVGKATPRVAVVDCAFHTYNVLQPEADVL